MGVCWCVYGCVCLCVQRNNIRNHVTPQPKAHASPNPPGPLHYFNASTVCHIPSPPLHPNSLAHLLVIVFVCVLLASTVHLKSAFLCKQPSASLENVCPWAWMCVCVYVGVWVRLCVYNNKLGTAPQHSHKHTRQRHPQARVSACRADARPTNS